MDLKDNISYDDLLSAIRQLPEEQLASLKQELSKPAPAPKENNAKLKELLLKMPVMSDEEYEEYKDTRRRINQWRSK